MKIKRIIFSTGIILFVFWLSIIIDLKKPTSDTEPITDTSISADSQKSSDEIARDKIQITQDNNIVASTENKLYKDTHESSETEDEISIYSESSDTAENNLITAFTLEEDIYEYDPPVNDPYIISAIEMTRSIIEESIKSEPSLYSDIAISVASNYVNIRKEASTDSQVLGKLYKGSAAKILDTQDDWYHVESGSVQGYVKADYLKTGIPDQELIENYAKLRIKVKVDGLNVREKPDTESKKLTCVYINEIYPVIELQDEWVKVDITDDKIIGYVKREYVDLDVTFSKAVSKEEEAELLRIQKEEQAKKETTIKYRDEMNYTNDDLKLLACLVHAEAGDQSYEGKLAVANIVLNRVKSSKFPNTIKDVIYQPGQFTVAKSGSLAKQLEKYSSYSTNSQLLSIKAAKAALSGANNIGNRLYFHSYKSAVRKGYDKKSNAVKLDDHLYW